MSNTSALSTSQTIHLLQPVHARRKLSISGLSLNGLLLFAASFLVVGSGFQSMRPEIMGLLLHPYLIPVALAFPFVVMMRFGAFPGRIAAALVCFIAIYYFSILAGGGIVLGEVFKMASSGLTIVTCALLVRRRGDFVAGSLGLGIAVAILAVRGLQGESDGGGSALDAANRNAYSLFALPPILLGGFICLRMPTVSMVVKGILVACTLAALATIFMSANRSGYLGSALIALMLFWNRRGRGLLLVGFVAGTLVLWISQFGDTKVFDERIRQTMEGNASDDYRLEIIRTCIEIGLSNPVIGVSPQNLPLELGRRNQVGHGVGYINSHNIFGHILAGSGIFCFLALAAVAASMWFWKPRNGIAICGKDDPLYEARSLMRMIIVLWAVRGVFTNDILYNPSFNIGIGLCIGLCILSETAREAVLTAGAERALATARPPNTIPRTAS
ncbi:MAG: O-antigen ligase family protein [Pirellulales bacterium]